MYRSARISVFISVKGVSVLAVRFARAVPFAQAIMRIKQEIL